MLNIYNLVAGQLQKVESADGIVALRIRLFKPFAYLLCEFVVHNALAFVFHKNISSIIANKRRKFIFLQNQYKIEIQMKTKSKFSSVILLLLVLANTICIVSSCEKHEGIHYFKSKCVAELNGQTLIDQTPFNIGPNSINTPSLDAGEYTVEFNSSLSNERGGDSTLRCNCQTICK